MNKTEARRAFIVNTLYFALVAALVFLLLKYALPLFMPFVIAYIISFVLKPLINKITEKTPLGRKAVAILVLTLVYLILGTLLVLLGAKLVVFLGDWFAGLPDFYARTIEPFLNDIAGWFENFITRLDPTLVAYFDMAGDSISRALSGLFTSISQGAVSALAAVATRVPWLVVGFLLCIVASFFFVVDYYRITGFLTRQFSENTRRLIFVIKDYVVNVLFKFAKAYLIIIGITFCELMAGLLILRVPNPVFIALITAVIDILPVLGTGTIMIPWSVYSLLNGRYFLGIGLLVLYAVIAVIRQIIEPRIVGTQIGLYPLLTLICMFIGARLFGFWGVFGLPITITVLIHLNRSGEIALYKE